MVDRPRRRGRRTRGREGPRTSCTHPGEIRIRLDGTNGTARTVGRTRRDRYGAGSVRAVGRSGESRNGDLVGGRCCVRVARSVVSLLVSNAYRHGSGRVGGKNGRPLIRRDKTRPFDRGRAPDPWPGDGGRRPVRAVSGVY